MADPVQILPLLNRFSEDVCFPWELLSEFWPKMWVGMDIVYYLLLDLL